MKKSLFYIGLFFLLIGISSLLSGCTETSGSKVQLVDEWHGMEGGYYTYKGKIKNIAGETIDVKVIVNFYDKNNDLLISKTAYVSNLQNNYTDEFRVMLFANETEKYSDIVDHIKCEFTTI